MTGLRAAKRLEVGSVDVIPIERVTVHVGRLGDGVAAWGAKDAAAVVVCAGSTVRAFDCDGSELPLDDLVRDVAGLRERLRETA